MCARVARTISVVLYVWIWPPQKPSPQKRTPTSTVHLETRYVIKNNNKCIIWSQTFNGYDRNKNLAWKIVNFISQNFVNNVAYTYYVIMYWRVCVLLSMCTINAVKSQYMHIRRCPYAAVGFHGPCIRRRRRCAHKGWPCYYIWFSNTPVYRFAYCPRVRVKKHNPLYLD